MSWEDRTRRALQTWETSPPMPSVGSERGPSYRCTQCDWQGKDALAHHRDNRHHAIVLRDMPQLGPVYFSCCSELAGAMEDER